MTLIIRYPKLRRERHGKKSKNCRGRKNYHYQETGKTCPICGEPLSSGDGVNCKKCGEPIISPTAN